jgi:hypothetical protein
VAGVKTEKTTLSCLQISRFRDNREEVVHMLR